MSHDRARALERVAAFPLLEALFGRRSRRFGRGLSIPSGPLAYTSRHAPQPLDEDERLLLIAIGAGVSGYNLGLPHRTSSGPDAGACHYPVRPVGRTYPSGAATLGSELLVTDDSGTYITRLRDVDARAIREHRTPSGGLDLSGALRHVREHLVRLSDRRVQVPNEYPHVGSHNQWVANQPGSTLFVPVADQAETLLNLLWIYAGEGAPIEDGQGRYLGAPGPLLERGLLRAERAVPLAEVEAVAVKHTTAELTIVAYNIQLGLQALGLGGWMYTGIHAGSLLGAHAAQGIAGFGFRCAPPQRGEEPRPLGLDGVFEPLVPPYVSDMTEAVRRFHARKFGPGGNYDPERPDPYRDGRAVKAGITPPPAEVLAYLERLARDIHDQHGRFPASISAVNAAIYAQAQHIDLAFYDRHYAKGAYLATHAEHQSTWHDDD